MADGLRFELNLDSDDENTTAADGSVPPPMSFGFVKDITERDSSNAVPPAPPQLTTSTTGFPEHKKRSPRPSRFKQRHAASSTNSSAPKTTTAQVRSAPSNVSFEEQSKIQASVDSQRALDSMSKEEIEEQRRELLAGEVPGVTSSLIERLLKRAAIDEDKPNPMEPPERLTKEEEPTITDSVASKEVSSKTGSDRPSKSVSFEDAVPSSSQASQQTLQSSSKSSPPTETKKSYASDLNVPLHPPSDLRPVTSKEPLPKPPPSLPSSTHFPSSTAPDLDPSSPSFLSDLQKHYFPNLSPDPSSLSWMAPLSTSPADSAYSPAATSLAPSELRFDFRGRLLPPNLSHQLPSHLGLHHHGQAPEAAGYTLGELALMSRSTMAPQRCVAYQTLGRVLYRLGKGVFGPEGSELYEGLWRLMEEGKVIEIMTREASQEEGRGNRSAWAVATEALWNWRMGGGKRWVAA